MTISIDPAYPAAGEDVALSSDVSDSTVTRFEITSIPGISTVSIGLIVDAAGDPSQTFTPDVPGEYGIIAHTYQQNVEPYTGSLWLRYTGPETATIYVGGYVDMPILPVNGHGSTLRLLVVNDTVREALLTDPLTELARVAALDTAVAAAISAMVGVAVNSIDVNFITDVNSMATAYEAHRTRTVDNVHNPPNGDTTNELLRDPAYSIPSAIARLNDLTQKLLAHAVALTSGGQWHDEDDELNTLQVTPHAITLGEATVLKADLRERVYERHRVTVASPAVHGAADNTNTLSAPLTLPTAIVAYLDFVASNAPSIPTGESDGIGDAQAALGFRPS